MKAVSSDGKRCCAQRARYYRPLHQRAAVTLHRCCSSRPIGQRDRSATKGEWKQRNTAIKSVRAGGHESTAFAHRCTCLRRGVGLQSPIEWKSRWPFADGREERKERRGAERAAKQSAVPTAVPQCSHWAAASGFPPDAMMQCTEHSGAIRSVRRLLCCCRGDGSNRERCSWLSAGAVGCGLRATLRSKLNSPASVQQAGRGGRLTRLLPCHSAPATSHLFAFSPYNDAVQLDRTRLITAADIGASSQLAQS